MIGNNANPKNHKDVTIYYIICPLLLLLGTFILYFPSFWFDFTIDDPLLTTENRDMVNFKGDYVNFFTTSLYAGTKLEQENRNLYRPILKSSIALNYQIAGYKFNPVYFHTVNVILYGACVIIIFFFTNSMFKSNKDSPIQLAFFTALLFMAFPSHLESVCNIKHREEIMSLLFALLSWLIVLRRTYIKKNYIIIGNSILASMFFLLAMFSKESALLIFPCMIIWEYIGNKHSLKGKNLPIVIYTFSCAIGIYFIFRYNALGELLSPSGTRTFFGPNENLITRALVSSRIFCKYYLWDQLVSLKLNPFFSSRFLVLNKNNPIIYDIAAYIFLFSIVMISIWQFVKTKSIYFFWIIVFFITSFLATNIIPIGTAGAFRLVFTPSIALCVISVMTLKISVHTVLDPMQLTKNQKEVIFRTLILLLIAFYGYSSHNRMSVWQNDGTIFSYSAMVEPGNPLSHVAAGTYYSKKGMTDRKYIFFEKGLKVFVAEKDQPHLFNERSIDAFSVVATELAYREVKSNPEKAIYLADLAIEQFDNLRRIRNGKIDSNSTAPYYVKALALKELGYLQKSADTCRAALAIAYHRGIIQLLKSLAPTKP